MAKPSLLKLSQQVTGTTTATTRGNQFALADVLLQDYYSSKESKDKHGDEDDDLLVASLQKGAQTVLRKLHRGGDDVAERVMNGDPYAQISMAHILNPLLVPPPPLPRRIAHQAQQQAQQ